MIILKLLPMCSMHALHCIFRVTASNALHKFITQKVKNMYIFTAAVPWHCWLVWHQEGYPLCRKYCYNTISKGLYEALGDQW